MHCHNRFLLFNDQVNIQRRDGQVSVALLIGIQPTGRLALNFYDHYWLLLIAVFIVIPVT